MRESRPCFTEDLGCSRFKWFAQGKWCKLWERLVCSLSFKIGLKNYLVIDTISSGMSAHQAGMILLALLFLLLLNQLRNMMCAQQKTALTWPCNGFRWQLPMFVAFPKSGRLCVCKLKCMLHENQDRSKPKPKERCLGQQQNTAYTD